MKEQESFVVPARSLSVVAFASDTDAPVVGAPILSILKEFVEVVTLVPEEYISKRFGEVVTWVPQKRMSKDAAIFLSLVPQMLTHTVEVVKLLVPSTS